MTLHTITLCNSVAGPGVLLFVLISIAGEGRRCVGMLLAAMMCRKLTLDALRDHTKRGLWLLQMPQHALVLCSTSKRSLTLIWCTWPVLNTTDQETCMQALGCCKVQAGWVPALSCKGKQETQMMGRPVFTDAETQKPCPAEADLLACNRPRRSCA